MSPALNRHLTRLLPQAPATMAPIQSIEYGAGGDCLFHSFAGALATMILKGGPPARHVLHKIHSEEFLKGQDTGAMSRGDRETAP